MCGRWRRWNGVAGASPSTRHQWRILSRALSVRPPGARRTHPDTPRIASRSVNKQFGGVQAIVNWARENGMISEHLWSDPFSNMRVDEDDPEVALSNPMNSERCSHRLYSPQVNV